MKTITINTFSFDELNDGAKEKAREWYRRGDTEYHWADEAMASIKKLAEHFGGKMRDWNIDWWNNSQSNASFEMPELDGDEVQARLEKLGSFNPETLKGKGDCILTGYAADEDAIDGFRKAWHEGERNLEKLMDAAFDSWLEAAHVDCARQNSDASVDESIRANGYEFTAEGKRSVTL